LTPHHHSPLHHRRFPPPRHIPSFPTRRSSDLGGVGIWLIVESHGPFHDSSVSVIVGRTVHFQRVFQILNDGNRLFVPHFHGGTPRALVAPIVDYEKFYFNILTGIFTSEWDLGSPATADLCRQTIGQWAMPIINGIL